MLAGDYKDNTSQSQENLHGSSWPVTSSAQMQSFSASVTLKHLLTEAHLLCLISNTLRKWPVLRAEHSAAERLKLRESLSRCLRSPKVFSLKFTEIFLSKDSALGFLLCRLLWRLIFWLPASVLSKNLQTIKKKEKTSHCYPDQTTKWQFSSSPAASLLFC